MQQAHDTFTIKLGDAIVQLPARAVVQNYLRSIIDTPAPQATPESNIPRIGELWEEQGGVYAGVMRGEHGAPDYHLIVPTDPRACNESASWGGSGNDEPNATSSLDGYANTQALAASKKPHPAAEWASDLTVDGFSDFYLPARRELRLCWVNVPELFVDGWHWSSTQYSANHAWYQSFADGGQRHDDKVYERRARAVRRLLIIR